MTNRKKSFVAFAATISLLAASPVFADNATVDKMSTPTGDQSDSSKAFASANGKMHKSLMMPYTGDPDEDFVHWMIPHHQGAIDTARVELQYGKDPQMLKMAKSILKQEDEIETMNAWLANHHGAN